MQVYADNAATTKISEGALTVLIDTYRDVFANPSSSHSFGIKAKQLLEKSRISIKRDLKADLEDYLIFTSGGSEADNQALEIFRRIGLQTGKKHIISSKFEHHAILNKLEDLKNKGFEIDLLDIPSDGIINTVDLSNAIRDDTVGVSIMFANNETGSIQNISKLSSICNEKNVLFHTDAVQAAGHINIDLSKLNIDLLSLSAHKFHGPKGIGVLYINKKVTPTSLIFGGSQEYGFRAGTQAIPEIAAMAYAFHEAVNNLNVSQKNLKEKSEKIMHSLLDIEGIYLNGDRFLRLPGTVNLTFKNIDQQSLKYLLENDGIAVSSGSACDSSNTGPSHVIKAMHPDYDTKDATIRISLDENITDEETDYLIERIKANVIALRETESLIYKK